MQGLVFSWLTAWLTAWLTPKAPVSRSEVSTPVSNTVAATPDLNRWCNFQIWVICLQIAYNPAKEKGFATKLIAMNPYLYWCRRDESNTRPSHYE